MPHQRLPLVLIQTTGSHLRQRFSLLVIFTPVAAVAHHMTTESNPETAGTTMFSLHCLCEGSSSVFPVQACHDTMISGLVEQVQQMAGLAEVSFIELELWKVSLWHCVRGETYFTPLPTGRHRSHTVQS